MDPARVWELAPLLVPWFEEPLELANGKAKPEDIIFQAEQGNLLIWLVMQPFAQMFVAAFVTEMAQFARKKVCRVIIAKGIKGQLRAWTALLPHLEQWAKVEGCEAMEIQGRKGWEKFLAPAGYEFEHLVITKEL